MIAVSDKWKDVQNRFLLPESFIEIKVENIPEGVLDGATASGTNEETYFDMGGILGENTTSAYATLEHNLWVLDGTLDIIPDDGKVDSGYVSNVASSGNITLSFSQTVDTKTNGLTITWGDNYGEYARVFTVTAKNGEEVVAETTITDNEERVTPVFLEMENYDSIIVTVHEWSVPDHRVRVENIIIGHALTLTKRDILSYSHEMTGDLLSGELPKYSIEFTLDNSDGRWNPNNPTGMEKYLSERQRLTVRYGFDLDGTVEWIDAGVFYLSEWDAPSNGLEARFVARDAFEFLIGTDTNKLPNMSSTQYGNLAFIITWAANALVLGGITVDVSESALQNSRGRQFNADGTFAEMVQKCANAAGCILRYDRNGALYVEKFDNTLTDYTITQALSYSHPEVRLLKPLKQVSVDYGGETPYLMDVATGGEIQTVTNDYIYTEDVAVSVAEWVSGVLKNRKTVSGEFRADPRLDLYDVVTVESKYGVLTPVVITGIKYEYNGSFRGSFTGIVLEVS